MDPVLIGLIGLVVLFVLLLIGMPIGVCFLAVGFFGIAALPGSGWKPAFGTMTIEMWGIAFEYQLIVIPLFILMGNFANIGGLGRDLYDAAYSWIGQFRGGLASTTIVAQAGFAALSGSSLASAVTMGRVALPEMKRYNYHDRLATGCVAAGGTLGFLIPPSAGMVVYAYLTEQNIAQLFLAGVIPGILLAFLFVVAIAIVTKINPELGPPGDTSEARRWQTLWRAKTIIGVILITIGGMYFGFFTPVEAAGVGALLTFFVTLARRQINLAKTKSIILQTVRTTSTLFLILIGARVFSPFMARTGVPELLVDFLLGIDVGTVAILAILLVTYMILGTFMEGFSMLVLTLPVVLPVLIELEVSLIWFGVASVIVIEMGLISPPLGINVFVVKGLVPDVPLGTIFAGIWPFWIAMAVGIAILLAFPQLALFLPETML
ncbi:MAG: TRAP transporter large permease [Alphaproteobacteria bacterium]|nr:TRAP transporter large permease [Alphaproteobacteria bacterium]